MYGVPVRGASDWSSEELRSLPDGARGISVGVTNVRASVVGSAEGGCDGVWVKSEVPRCCASIPGVWSSFDFRFGLFPGVV